MFAEIVKRDGQLAADMLLHRAGNGDAAWMRQRLYARRDIDAVTVDVVTVDDDVADIDADAELDAVSQCGRCGSASAMAR